jgi:isoquinoline 1-oxidoreductase beta subunit
MLIQMEKPDNAEKPGPVQLARCGPMGYPDIQDDPMDRRSFIRLSTYSAGAWLLSDALAPALAQQAGTPAFQPSPLIRIDSDGQVTLYVQKQEMGQGVLTSLPVLLAEELDADFSTVRVLPLPYDAAGASQYNTWASASVRGGWSSLRRAGAAARSMLASAAAAHWKVAPERVRTANSTVINLDTQAVLSYGALAEAASRLPVPAHPLFKDRSAWTLIGKPLARRQVRDKVNGKTVFGIDMRLPDMVHATVLRSPTFHGKPRSFDDSAVRALGPGILAVQEVRQLPGCDNRNGVAVIATSTWLALRAQSLLKVEWDHGAVPNADSAALSQALRAAVDTDTPALSFDARGKSRAYAPAEGAHFSAEYELPFLNQAPMEPLNCIARFQDGRFEVWGGFQAPGYFATTLAKAFAVDRNAIFVHLLPMGGAFGRKEKVDNAADAMQLAQALSRPVQVVYSRPDDMRNSFYRPATFHRLGARADSGGIHSWRHQAAVASFPGKGISSPQHLPGGPSNDLIYPVGDYQTAFYPVESPVPIGSWRAIAYSQNVFAVECFIDELARHHKRDPLQFRLALLRQPGPDAAMTRHRQRMEAVLARCAEAIGWHKAPPKGRHRGLACCVYTHTHAYTAHAFEVSVTRGKAVKIHRAVCVTDCGLVIDASGFRAQIEGSLVWALSAAMTGEISVSGGAVDQQNFSDYPVLRMHEMPRLELIVMDSDETPAGAGEPAVPSVAPALCNAIAAATGQPIRSLPLAKAGYTLA